MGAQDQLGQAIDTEQRHLRATVPRNREAALLALLRTLSRVQRHLGAAPIPDAISANHLANPGGNTALRLIFESTASATVQPATSSCDGVDRWAGRFLDACGRLAEIEMVLAHCKSGFMRLVDDGAGDFNAWIATRRIPAVWRERVDFDWWATHSAERHKTRYEVIASRRQLLAAADPALLATCLLEADVRLEMMAYQISSPGAAVVEGTAIQTHRDVLRFLIAWALRAQSDGNDLCLQDERTLIDAISSTLAVDPASIGRAVSAFTVDAANAGWHATVPGVAAAPLVRVGPGQVALSLHGLTSEPLLFLARELRRRSAQAYHDSARLREDVFRQDLYDRFPERRFVTSPRRIELRQAGGDVRTDIDAVIFDRKTGTLGLFELKSQDPFARSTAEQIRQRDNILYANRQISGILDWVNRHGANDVLDRVDSRTAKTFRVQKVYPFVLGRYLAHFNDGPEPDRRAAWGTWPQVLRVFDDPPSIAQAANPIASLHSRLRGDQPLLLPSVVSPARELTIGAVRLIVHPSYAAFRDS